MPVQHKPWFNELGLAYAKAYVEVDTAKREYDSQVRGILDHLIAEAESAMRESKLARALREPDDQWEYFYIPGAYSELRKKRGRNPERASGFCFGFGRDSAFAPEAPYGFGAYLLFNISSRRFTAFPFNEVMARLTTTVGSSYGGEERRFPHAFEGGYGWFRIAWITYDSERFELESMTESVRSLPVLWSTSDRLMTEAYEQRWPRSDGE